MATPSLTTDVELRRISWACLEYWNGEPLPPEERAICHKWIARVYESRFHERFAQQRLAVLARLGVLAKDDTSRRGDQRYYRLVDPAALGKYLSGASLN
jgi:hypothetical protein